MSFAIDIAVLVLLVGTLGYAWLVDRRVRRMMEAMREMEPMIGSFSQAVDRSESTVSALRAAREVAPLRKRPEPPRPEARAEAAPETSDPGAEPAFRSKREPAPRPADATPISGKSELIRGFFDTVRQREA
ncbi:MAG: flagellar motor switch protein [Marinovum algicola]|uniref:Flagellar motor switch protein n=1 Tax=Marinovum algicola TaxID=42444 RepID=A0A975ZPQ7_9RHOB|nr:hypothetical protein [Marinovum algicola]AKO99650.1 putative flagellar motor protein [Marinovum algicola DG 898]SEJ93381.1 hypothetical protein SAMN04487940_11484 [Marinovum algicola]SLN64283.1 hypothetical protein MAA5396_03431 [Marinovum algicola]